MSLSTRGCMKSIKYLVISFVMLFSTTLWAENSKCIETLYQIQKDFKTSKSMISPRLYWMDLTWLKNNLGAPEINANEYKWLCKPNSFISATINPANNTIDRLQGKIEINNLQSWGFSIDFKESTSSSFTNTVSPGAPTKDPNSPSTTILPPVKTELEIKDMKPITIDMN